MKKFILIFLFFASQLFAQMIEDNKTSILSFENIDIGIKEQSAISDTNSMIFTTNGRPIKVDSVVISGSYIADNDTVAKGAWIENGNMTVTDDTLFSNIPEELAPNGGNFVFNHTELVTNGTFAVDANWTKGAGWTIGSGVASSDGSQTPATSYLYQSSGIVQNDLLYYSYDVTITTDRMKFLLGGSPYVNDIWISASGPNSGIVQSTGTGNYISLLADDNFVGTVDNISVHKLVAPSGWSTAQATNATNYIIEYGDAARFVSDASTTKSYYANVLTIGHTYKYVIDVTVNSGSFTLISGSSGSTIATISASGIYSDTFVQNDTTGYFIIYSSNTTATDVIINSISLVEVFDESSSQISIPSEQNRFYKVPILYREGEINLFQNSDGESSSDLTINSVTFAYRGSYSQSTNYAKNGTYSLKYTGDGSNATYARSRVLNSNITEGYYYYWKGYVYIPSSNSVLNHLYIRYRNNLGANVTLADITTTDEWVFFSGTTETVLGNTGTVCITIETPTNTATSESFYLDDFEIFKLDNVSQTVEEANLICQYGNQTFNLNTLTSELQTDTIRFYGSSKDSLLTITFDDTCKAIVQLGTVERIEDNGIATKDNPLEVRVVTDISTLGNILDSGIVYANGKEYPFTVSGTVIEKTYTIDAPTNLVAENNTVDGINLSWTDPNAPDTNIYRAYNFSLASQLDSFTYNATYFDAEINAGKLYLYDIGSSTQPKIYTTISANSGDEFIVSVDMTINSLDSIGLYIVPVGGSWTTRLYNSNFAVDGSDTAIITATGDFYVYLQGWAFDVDQYGIFDNLVIKKLEPSYDGYEIYRQPRTLALTPDGDYSLLYSATGDATSYKDAISLDSSAFAYKARFYKDSDYSDYSNVASVIFSTEGTAPSNPFSADFFVSADSGNDANTGYAQSNAWKTLSRVVTAINNGEIVSGDTIMFKGGFNYYDTQLLISSKTYSSNIVFMSHADWGTGKAEIGDSATSRDFNAKILNSDHVSFYNLKFWGYYASAGSGSDGGGLRIANGDHIIVDECDFVGGKDRHNLSRYLTGISIGSGSTPITISNCTFTDIPQGIEGSTSSTYLTTPLAFTIYNNTFTNNYASSGTNYGDADALRITGNGDDAQDYEGTVISHNYFTGWGENAIDLNSASNVLVEYNLMETPSTIAQCNFWSYGIKFGDDNSVGNVFRYNVIRDINKGATTNATILAVAPDGKSNVGVNFANSMDGEVYGNLIYDVEGEGINDPKGGLAVTGAYIKIYNNTIISDSYAIKTGGTTGDNDMQIANNILYSLVSSNPFQIYDHAVITKNIFGVNLSNLNAYGLSYIDDSLDVNYYNYDLNDIVLDTASGNYRIDSTSIAWNNAYTSALGTDNFGNGFFEEKLDYPLDNHLTNSKAIVNDADIGAFEQGTETIVAPTINSFQLVSSKSGQYVTANLNFYNNGNTEIVKVGLANSIASLSINTPMNITGSNAAFTFNGVDTSGTVYLQAYVLNEIDTTFSAVDSVVWSTETLDSVIVAVGEQRDDLHWIPTTGYTTYTNTSNFVGNNSNIIHAFTRFPNVIIPSGASIVSAKIRFVAYTGTNSNNTVNWRFTAEDTQTPAIGATVGTDMDTRLANSTTAYEDYNAIGAWTGGVTYEFDVTSIIQELYASYDYSSGNAIGIFIKDNGSTSGASIYRRFLSFDNGSNYPAISIVYSY